MSGEHDRRVGDEKLNEFMDQMRVCVTELRTMNAHLSSLVMKHETDLRGNGKPGLVVEVDRLVQTDKSRKWVVRTALGAGVAALAESARQHLFPR